MDFLNTALSQLKDLFQGMTPGSRIIAGLLVAMVVVSLGYLVTQRVSGSDAYLFNSESFSTGELQAMEAAFAAAGLNDYEIEGAKIRVPRTEKFKYVAALGEGKALPKGFGAFLDSALASSNIFESRDQREARLKAAKQQDLSQIIGTFHGVERAAVFFDTETKPGFLKEKVTTATVSVKPLGANRLDENLVSSICQTMVGAVAGLKPENVVITDLNANRAFRGDPEDQAGGLGSSHAAKKREYERDWETKILALLSTIPGVIVTPNVELNRETSFRERQSKPDLKGTVSQRMEQTTTRSRDGSDTGGRPGYVAQGNTARTLTPTTQTQGNHEEEETSDLTESNLVGGMENEKDYAGLTPKLVTVSIAVPASYFRKVWQEQNQVKPGEQPKEPTKTDLDQIQATEVAKIKGAVAPLLPPLEGAAASDPTQLVQVSAFQDITPQALPQPSMAQNAVTWLGEYWRTLGLVGLALVSLTMLRSMVTAVPPPARQPRSAWSAPLAAKDLTREETRTDEDRSKPSRQFHFKGGGLSLRDELSGLVREDPDTAASILRNWIGNVTTTK